MSLAARYLRTRPDQRGDVAAVLEALHAHVLGALPEVKVDVEAWVDRLAMLDQDLETLTEERAMETALALASANADNAALRFLESQYLSRLPRVLAHMSLDGDLVADVGQEVRRKLLVGDPPKLKEYAGRGSLAGLIKVTAVRSAISMLRKTQRESPIEERLELAASHDLELSYLKEKYRGAFQESFELAIRGLERQERNLLRLHFLGRVTLPQLATMYGVHRATIIRKLQKTREKLEKQTRRGMRDRLSLPASELDSIMDLVRSRMDISVERMLQTLDASS